MQLKLLEERALYMKATTKSQKVAVVPKGTQVVVLGPAVIWRQNIPWTEVKYNDNTGYLSGRQLLGLVIQKVAVGNSKYPRKVKVVHNDGVKNLRIPQQKEFGSWCSNHGCSVAAVSIALQTAGVDKSPREVLCWCKKNISGWMSEAATSKLTIFGCMKALNGISGTKKAVWYPMDKQKRSDDVERISNALKQAKVVLIEQKNPIHTNIIVGRRANGKALIATNGVLKEVTVATLVYGSLTGKTGKNKQKNWFHGAEYGAGYVIFG